jgi:PAS domain S-box-containing protein
MTSQDPLRRTSLLLLVIFLLLVAGIGTAGRHYYLAQRQAVEAKERDQLGAIAEMKVSQVEAWRNERLSDARAIMANAMMIPALERVLDGTADSSTQDQVRTWLHELCSRFYANAILVDFQGVVHMAEGRSTGAQQHYVDLAKQVVQTNDVILRDFHRDAGLAPIHLGLNIPLRVPGGGRPIGVLLLGIDPNDYLYPLIQSWPTPSPTAESLLVRRDGDEVLFLNELRHRKNTAMQLRFPLTDLRVPAVRTALGWEGIDHGIDYRGVPVLAAARRVSGSPWILVVKTDEAEIYAPMRQSAFILALTVASLIAAAGAGVGFLLRHLRSNFYRQKYKSESERRRLLEQYEYLTRHANDIILLMDPSGGIVDANERAASTYGYARDELIGMNIRDLRDPDTMHRFESEWSIAGQVEGLIFETRHRRRDGTIFPVEVSVRALAVGGSMHRQSIIRDISERKGMEQNLRESENRFRQLVEGTPEGIFVQTDLCFRYLNPAALALFGARSQEELTGQPVMERLHPDCRDAVAERIRVLNEERKPVPRMEQKYLKIDGTVFEVEVSAVPITFEGRGGAVVFFRDVTERKKAAQERTRLEEQFRQAQKMESVGRLAGGVAHDFNNHLTVINGYCDLLLAGLDPTDPMHASLDEIRRAGERAASLTRQLLAFSRKQVLEPKPLNLNEVVADLETMLRRLVGEDIELLTRLDPALGQVMADAGQMHQVLMNLVVNARDAMPKGGRLIIETLNVDLGEGYFSDHMDAVCGPFVMLTVSDSGSGMDRETQQRIFEPFFTTKRSGAGTGLGLSTVYGIVKQSGGWIWVYSEPDQGTTFKIYMPRICSPSEKAQAALPAGDRLHGSETILIVEDQAEVRNLTSRVLTKFGYRVLSAAGGKEALALCEKHNEMIHLMITDVVMPGMTGRELAGRLAQMKPEMKVLYVSGYTADAIAHQGMLDPGVAYLPKPFSPDGLLRKVRELFAG